MSTLVSGFFAAIRTGDLAAIKTALGADPALAAKRNEQGLSPVMWACYLRQSAALALLRAANPPLDLFEAIASGDDALAAALLAAQPALADAWSADGFTALHLAAYFGRPAPATLLLAAGADPSAESRNPMRVTPLHSAASAGQLEIARALLAAGAPPDARQQGGYTPLMAAAQNGDEPLVELLLSHRADPALRTEEGQCASGFAEEKGHTALAAKLRPR